MLAPRRIRAPWGLVYGFDHLLAKPCFQVIAAIANATRSDAHKGRAFAQTSPMFECGFAHAEECGSLFGS